MEDGGGATGQLPVLHDDFMQTLHDTGLYSYAEDIALIHNGQLPFQTRTHGFHGSEDHRLWPSSDEQYGLPAGVLSDESLREGESRIAAATTAVDAAVTAAEQVLVRQKAAQEAEYEDGLLCTPNKPRKMRKGLGRGTDFGGRGNSKGLRHFSMKVCEKVEGKGRTTYNEVADELVNDLPAGNEPGSPNSLQYDEKNIRRRVYDALNVLMAMDIISREKKEIFWKGLPQGPQLSLERLKNERQRLCQKVDLQRRYIADLTQQQATYRALIARNRSRSLESIAQSGKEQLTALSLPFVLIQVDKNATVEIKISEDNRVAHFDFEGMPFKFTGDEQVLQEMGLASADDALTARALAAAADTASGRPTPPLQNLRHPQSSGNALNPGSRIHPVPSRAPVRHIPLPGLPPGQAPSPGAAGPAAGDLGLSLLGNAATAAAQRPSIEWMRVGHPGMEGQLAFAARSPEPGPAGQRFIGPGAAAFRSPPEAAYRPPTHVGGGPMDISPANSPHLTNMSPQILSMAAMSQGLVAMPGGQTWPAFTAGQGGQMAAAPAQTTSQNHVSCAPD